MDAFYLGLEEVDEAPDKSVGEVFKLEDSVYLMVPFIHCGHHFLTYFSPVQGTPELPFDIFKSAVEANSDHIVSDSPYILKLIVKQYINIIDIYILLLLYLILQQHHLLVDIHRHRRHRQY